MPEGQNRPRRGQNALADTHDPGREIGECLAQGQPVDGQRGHVLVVQRDVALALQAALGIPGRTEMAGRVWEVVEI